MNSTLALFIWLNWFLTAVFTALIIAVLIRVKNNFNSKCLLILLMICQVYARAVITLKTSGVLFDKLPFLYRSGYPFELASSTLIYLYILSVTKADFEFKNIKWFHFLPFIFGWIWYFSVPVDLSSWQIDKYMRSIPAFLIMIPYLWASRKAISQTQIHAENQRSSLIELHLPWLRFLLFICYAALALKFLDLITGPQVPLYVYSGIITNLAFIGLTYYGLSASEFFKQDEAEDIPREEEEAPPQNNSAPASIPSPEFQELSEVLLKLLKEKELYLQPQIRLIDVANEMGIKSYKLTDVINQGLKTNFYELINGLRIQRAMDLLRDPSKDHLNLLGIAMDSGFNSKSVFNDYFRRQTGMTPSDFRQNQINPSESANPDV